MNRTLLGAFATLLLAASGLFWWQGRAMVDPGALPPAAMPTRADPLSLPTSDITGVRGPDLPEATEQTREQRRFDRLDRDRDGRISRVEMLVPRAAMFRKLDADGNNLLTFEEWAAVTANRFRGADRNSDKQLDRIEFATTKPKLPAKPVCNCVGQVGRGRGKAKSGSAQPGSALDDPDFLSDQDGEPVG